MRRAAFLALLVIFSCALKLPSAVPQDDLLTGAGATFPAPIYEKWIAAFEEKHPGMKIAYSAAGSEEGNRRFAAGQIDFAGSDIAPDALAEKPAGMKTLPTVVGAVVPVYNVPGLRHDVKFSGEVLAFIYLGKIRKWNDPRIAALNRDLHLPPDDIAVLHRADGSGTTFVFSDFLSKTSPDWKKTMGAAGSFEWPLGEGAQGNEGMAAKVAATGYSLGYVEFIYAVRSHLSYAAVRNSAGQFIRADEDSLIAAAKSVAADGTLSMSITNASGQDVYPIASFTWLLLPARFKSEAKRTRMLDFLDWALTAGQRQAAALGYIALPEVVAARARQTVASLRTAGGH